jgi:hypothetical protein
VPVSQNRRQAAAECRQWKLTLLLQLVERKNQLGVMRAVNVSAGFSVFVRKVVTFLYYEIIIYF